MFQISFQRLDTTRPAPFVAYEHVSDSVSIVEYTASPVKRRHYTVEVVIASQIIHN